MATTGRKYAQIVNPQVNPNNPKQEKWDKITNAVGGTTLMATSHYTKTVTTTGKGKNKKTKTTYNNPYKVTAHDFQLNIPSNAKIDEIRVVVRMKSSKNGTGSEYPAVGFFIRDGGKTVKSTASGTKTGWHNNTYWAYSKKRLSTSTSSATYTMSGADFKKGGYTVADLNSTLCGVDLYFHNQVDTQTVYLMYVYMKVDYTVPTYTVTTNPVTSKDNPYQMSTGVKKNVEFIIKQSENMQDVGQALEFKIPWGTELDGVPYVRTNGDNVYGEVRDTEDSRKKVLLVEFGGKGTATLVLPIIDYTVDVQEISLTNITSPKPLQPIPDKTFYYQTEMGIAGGYDETTITYTAPSRKRHTTCFKVNSHAISQDDDEIIFDISNSRDYTFVTATLDAESSSSGVSLVSVPEEDDMSANEVVPLTFKVPMNSEVNINFNVCIRPHIEGENRFKVQSEDSDIPHSLPYQVLEPYVYHIGSTDNENEDSDPPEWHEVLLAERIDFTNHRIASNLETGAFILPCHVKDGDAIMIQEKPTIHMYKWEELDYIGCVPLEHLHFDPKSTYKDKLLDSHYKNKRYMGKELASDEDITLNVRLHPHQVTTMQGLIDMDKPIPINANHRCFEGDALNHRGWAEIYGITTTLTNPHWYKCDIDVKYLTHNLNTRFHINKGDKTFATFPIPSMLSEVNPSGSVISNNSDDDFFTVDTDGTYSYVEDTSEWADFLDYQGNSVTWDGGYWDDNTPSEYHGTLLTVEEPSDEDDDGTVNLITYKAVASPTDNTNEIYEYLISVGETVKDFVVGEPIKVREDYLMDDALKNRFTLDEGQHISIKSREPLSNQNQITLRWASSKLAEDIENAISRITRLIDEETGDIVFEYEYCDFDFSNFIAYTDQTSGEEESVLSCRVIGRRKNNADYDVVIDDMIDLQSDVETREYSFVEDGETHTELVYYGDSIIFELKENHLKLVDEGYNGKEVEREFDLEGNQYRWETYWENKNTGGENDDIIAYFDVAVQDSVISSKFADKYGSMYISPFPVSNKQILFTRKGEEGIIYYLDDNKEEFTYLIEPYYQYYNGVDLRNESGASIFNLNYGYKTIYLENGLVSLGINRLTGKMFLRKFNPVSEEYETLFNLHLNKYDDININSISDDRIELQASDSTIIMYRGHPYVIFKHELEDIGLDSRFYQVYGQSVDGISSEYPVYFDLMNKDNLLTDCVTKKLDDDCVNITEHDIDDLTPVTLKLVRDGDDTVYENSTITLNVTDDEDNPFLDRVCYLVKYDKDDGFDEIGCNSDGTFSYPNIDGQSLSQGVYSFIAVYVGDDTHTYAVSNEIVVQVGETPLVPPVTPSPTPTPPLTGDYKLTMSSPSTMEYLDGSEVIFTLTKGGVPVSGETIEMTDFHYTNTALTNSKGQVSFKNLHPTSHPQKYKLGAKFWYDNSRKMIKVYKDVTVKKATPEFHINHRALVVGNTFSVNLRDSKRTGNKLAKRKVTITVNGSKKNRVTNEKGSEAIKIEKKGTYKYICTFDGDKDYKACKLTYREKVINLPVPNIGGN